MESKIRNTLLKWFPDAFSSFNPKRASSDYDFLQEFARYTHKLMTEDSDHKKEPFRIINLLYFNGSLYEKNAIENEFLCTLAKMETTHVLKNDLELMPESLRAVYLKTIIEN